MGLDMFLTSKGSEVAYWRKANAIHKWFVDNVQNGTDDCGEYPVSQDQIRNLLATVEQVIENKDPTLLPTQGGFFFGNTDIDEFYWAKMSDTRDRLRGVLKGNYEDLRYQSSW